MFPSIEQHVDWMVDCISHMRDIGAQTIEPTLPYEDDWVDHVNEVSKISLRSTCSSWYVGANIPGRPRVFMPYIGGFPIYVNKCNNVMENGYEGFTLDGANDSKRDAADSLDRTLADRAGYGSDVARRDRRRARTGGLTSICVYRQAANVHGIAAPRESTTIVASGARSMSSRFCRTARWISQACSICRKRPDAASLDARHTSALPFK